MVTVEQTEKVESGLDVVVRGEHGGIICWCYSMHSAEMIANALNNSCRTHTEIGDALAVNLLTDNATVEPRSTQKGNHA